jgi:folate-binding protein YgfZ
MRSETRGDATSEYRAAREAAGFVALPERGLLEVSGPSRQSFLQGMLSNEVAALGPGQGCRAALLTAKGTVQALVRVLVEDTAVLLETDLARIATLERTLEHHRVAAPARFAPRATAVFALLGPRAEAVASFAGTPPPAAAEAHATVTWTSRRLRLVRAGDLPGGGIVIHTAPEDASAVRDALLAAGARTLGRETLDALRVEKLRPWYGFDLGEANLLHESGLVGECSSPAKGCYLGQEMMARLAARGGHVSKALRGLRLGAPARSGDAILVQGREVGRVTTAAVSPRLGPIAMGYLHRDHFAAGTAVEVGGAAATVVTVFEE